MSHRVALREGNETIRRLMADVLGEARLEVSILDAGLRTSAVSGQSVVGRAAAPLADLLVVDVDSGAEAPERDIEAYRAADRPVLVVGLSASRDGFANLPWLTRPFTGAAFLRHCEELLGIARADRGSVGPNDETPPPPLTLQAASDEPPTVELGINGALGPAEGSDAASSATFVSDEFGALGVTGRGGYDLSNDELASILDFDVGSSMILEVEDLESDLMRGGMLIGRVESRKLGTEELTALAARLHDASRLASTSPTQTVPEKPAPGRAPEVPAERSDIGASRSGARRYETGASGMAAPSAGAPVTGRAGTGGTGSGSSGTGSGARSAGHRPFDSQSIARLRRSSGTHGVSAPAAGLSQEIIQAITGTSHMLAESWDRLGLAARTEDRADRIERILFALFKEGLRGASNTISRIPAARGFSGSLDTLPLVDLFHTLRERRLRGRLELCIEETGYVLYIEAGQLEDIDTLGGSTDALLLDILYEHGALDEGTYRRFQALHAEDDGLSAPLELRLRTERLVNDAALRSARRARARVTFRQLFAGRGGNFSFIDLTGDEGHAWPGDGLRLVIDELLLDVLRDDLGGEPRAVGPGPRLGAGGASVGGRIDGAATGGTAVGGAGGVEAGGARVRLVLDSLRTAGLDLGVLTHTERELLTFFRDGRAVSEARDHFSGGLEDIDRVVARLVRAELLRPQGTEERFSRTTPMHGTPMLARASARLEASVADAPDPYRAPTAVSDWAIGLPADFEIDDEDEPTQDRDRPSTPLEALTRAMTDELADEIAHGMESALAQPHPRDRKETLPMDVIRKGGADRGADRGDGRSADIGRAGPDDETFRKPSYLVGLPDDMDVDDVNVDDVNVDDVNVDDMNRADMNRADMEEDGPIDGAVPVPTDHGAGPGARSDE